MNRIVYFHRSIDTGVSIYRVTQTVIRNFNNRVEYRVPYSGTSPINIIRNIWFVWRHRDKNAINHVTGDVHYCIMALIGCKSVLTIHDTVTVDFQEHTFLERFLLKWIWFRIPLFLATKVVCISESTKNSVLKYTSRKDIEVIHNAISPDFVNIPSPPFRKKARILFIGTSPNKNLRRCIDALKGVDCMIVLVGRMNDELKEYLLGNNCQFENLVDLSDEQIIEEYRKCDIVSFVSLFEGFGMIIIEANKVGRPIICSDIPVLKEVAGDSALFVNPLDVESIHSGYQKLINDENLRSSLIERGLKNVTRFDSVMITNRWMALYDRL